MNTPEGPYRFELHNPRRPWWTIYSSNGIRMFDFDSKFAAAEAAYALNAQHAEIERLRSELQKADNTIARERTESDGLVAALEAEIERLREALNDVLDAIVCPELSTSRMREIRALAQEASE